VHASEVPNIASLLSGGELLLSTGMGLGSTPGARRRYLEALAARGIAAFVLELGTTFERVPRDLRELAERLGMPLVALHREVPFVMVTEAIHTELVNRRYALFQEGESIRQRLIDVMLEGEGVAELIATFSAIVGNPVFLEGPDATLLFHAGEPGELEAWERLGAGGGGLSAQASVPMGRASGPGRVVVLGVRHAPSELDAIALGHAAQVVALALLRAREEEELVVRERGNLLANLLEGRVDSPDAARQAARMGLRVPGEGSLLAIAFAEHPVSSPPSRSAALADLQRALDPAGIPALVGARGRRGDLLALVTVRDPARRDATASETARAIRRTWDRRLPGTRLTIAIDGPTGWEHAGAALSAASETLGCVAARSTRGSRAAEGFYDAAELELERLLWSLRGEKRVQAYVRRTLGALIDHDESHRLALLPTLEALCACGGQKAQAARSLHLHRQALYHRLARIERLLGVSLADPRRLLDLHVALRARACLGELDGS
jgi:purine catabolism regulator